LIENYPEHTELLQGLARSVLGSEVVLRAHQNNPALLRLALQMADEDRELFLEAIKTLLAQKIMEAYLVPTLRSTVSFFPDFFFSALQFSASFAKELSPYLSDMGAFDLEGFLKDHPTHLIFYGEGSPEPDRNTTRFIQLLGLPGPAAPAALEKDPLAIRLQGNRFSRSSDGKTLFMPESAPIYFRKIFDFHRTDSYEMMLKSFSRLAIAAAVLKQAAGVAILAFILIGSVLHPSPLLLPVTIMIGFGIIQMCSMKSGSPEDPSAKSDFMTLGRAEFMEALRTGDLNDNVVHLLTRIREEVAPSTLDGLLDAFMESDDYLFPTYKKLEEIAAQWASQHVFPEPALEEKPKESQSAASTNSRKLAPIERNQIVREVYRGLVKDRLIQTPSSQGIRLLTGTDLTKTPLSKVIAEITNRVPHFSLHRWKKHGFGSAA